ncbi:sodium:neurotransmitter symporter [Perkinsela sp. CCAP 1560/4]|nr:sodium:neurotransmitter symporter [Perkinsela sp. CCAP 1560/4]|eukprot:KNH07981.1 sodium:neurotransmitter symporter [Perkinsela sp. CCAP 1560/4]
MSDISMKWLHQGVTDLPSMLSTAWLFIGMQCIVALAIGIACCLLVLRGICLRNLFASAYHRVKLSVRGDETSEGNATKRVVSCARYLHTLCRRLATLLADAIPSNLLSTVERNFLSESFVQIKRLPCRLCSAVNMPVLCLWMAAVAYNLCIAVNAAPLFVNLLPPRSVILLLAVTQFVLCLPKSDEYLSVVSAVLHRVLFFAFLSISMEYADNASAASLSVRTLTWLMGDACGILICIFAVYATVSALLRAKISKKRSVSLLFVMFSVLIYAVSISGAFATLVTRSSSVLVNLPRESFLCDSLRVAVIILMLCAYPHAVYPIFAYHEPMICDTSKKVSVPKCSFEWMTKTLRQATLRWIVISSTGVLAAVWMEVRAGCGRNAITSYVLPVVFHMLVCGGSQWGDQPNTLRISVASVGVFLAVALCDLHM